MRVSPRLRFALLPGALLAATVWLMGEVGLQRAELPTLSVLYATAFLALLWAWTRHRTALEKPGVILLWAVVFRALLLPALPDLSDDAFRYVWDGWLAAMGQNPYTAVPQDPALAPFHDSELLERMNSPEYHSVYPPFSQVVFFFPGIVHEFFDWPWSFYALKGLVVTLEVLGIALMLGALRSAGRAVAPVVLYAWNPLALVTVAGNGHTEGIMLLGIGLLALGVYRLREGAAWVGVTLAGLTKLVPFVAIPLLVRRAVELRRAGPLVWGVAAGGVVGAALVAPFWHPQLLPNMASSLELYVREFEFAAGAYFLLQELGLRLAGENLAPLLGPALKGVVAMVLLGVVLFHRCKEPEAFFRALLAVVSAYLLLATTVHPWYLLWALALVPFTPFLRAPWTWASFAAFGTYFTYVGVPHRPLAALLWVGFVVVALASAAPAGYDALLRWAGRRKARRIAPHLGTGRILDLGAGEGYVAGHLSGQGRRFVLTDVAPSFRLPVPGVIARGERLPFSDGAFDGVVVSLVLHHATDPEGSVREALRVSSGPVVVTESVVESPREERLLRFLDRLANAPRERGTGDGMNASPGFRSREGWVELFQRAGGRVERVEVLNRWVHRHELFVVEPAEVSPPKAARTSPP